MEGVKMSSYYMLAGNVYLQLDATLWKEEPALQNSLYVIVWDGKYQGRGPLLHTASVTGRIWESVVFKMVDMFQVMHFMVGQGWSLGRNVKVKES